ncbi:hypothetical protein AVEN_161580-1 [Araneus ventricosus]|uniref:Uncharacterized protein n=1 Tax=Araneus ventricosus TaxID=182803 RepID=A0A4Y2FKF1_ARAVE|nr:hypothetical protein AVEN_161580-1 [Araneus ventricosus]
MYVFLLINTRHHWQQGRTSAFIRNTTDLRIPPLNSASITTMPQTSSESMERTPEDASNKMPRLKPLEAVPLDHCTQQSWHRIHSPSLSAISEENPPSRSSLHDLAQTNPRFVRNGSFRL